MRQNLILFFYCLFLHSAPSLAGKSVDLHSASGADLLTGKNVELDLKSRKGAVIVFLSAVCPCSNSHVQELAALAREYPEFSFLGVHSNTDEKKDVTQAYFSAAQLPFPVIQDREARIADLFKAYKTPHAFLVGSSGEILYQGGVSSSRNFANAERKFLREALEDLKIMRPIRTSEGRTLGCVISREHRDVW